MILFSLPQLPTVMDSFVFLEVLERFFYIPTGPLLFAYVRSYIVPLSDIVGNFGWFNNFRKRSPLFSEESNVLL